MHNTTESNKRTLITLVPLVCFCLALLFMLNACTTKVMPPTAL